jgi:chaperonin GroES
MFLMIVEPLLDNVLIEPVTKTDSPDGMVLPDSSKTNNLTMGIVLACGEGRRTVNGDLMPFDFAPHDQVIFRKRESDLVNETGKELYLVSADSILAIIYEKAVPKTDS